MEDLAGRGVSRVIHIASCFELATAPSDHTSPFLDDHPIGAWSAYGASKAKGAEAAVAAGDRLGVPVVVLRLFGVYGPGEPPHRFVPHVIERLSRGEPAELSEGRQLRDWTYIDDAAEAIAAAADATGLGAGPHNVCSGVPIAVRAVAEQIADALGASRDLLRFGARPMREGEPHWLVGDPSCFQATTGWRPRVSLDEGLRRTIDAQRS